jgi:hypothetical protein
MTWAPLTAAEIAELGYERQPNGTWKLVHPKARPKPRSGLCRGCQKFDAMFDGLCAGCVYFTIGDPHGVNIERQPVRPDEVPDLLHDAGPSPLEKFRARLREIARGEHA